MRIAINAAYLRRGAHDGIANFGRGLIRHLAELDEDLLLYSPEAMESIRGKLYHRKTPEALSVRNGPLAGLFRVGVWSQTILPYRALQDHANVLLCPVPEGMFRPMVPQVIVVHDLFPAIFPHSFGYLRQYVKYGLPAILAASEKIIAASKQTKNDIVAHFGIPEDKVRVVYQGIDPTYFSNDAGVAPAGHQEQPFFLFVGRGCPHKNLETVLHAFAINHATTPHQLVAVIDVYGKEDENNVRRLLRLASSLGIRERLRIHSHLTCREILFLYRNATAVVLLSKYEGFGLPPLEAMAVGTPAIVSNSSALGEVAGGGAICVPSDDPVPAAEAMRQLACDPEFHAAQSRIAAEYARRFTWKRAACEVREILAQIAR
ncbi:MAG: glycosyltransferase family 4 protein [Acidobacteriota bacterium]